MMHDPRPDQEGSPRQAGTVNDPRPCSGLAQNVIRVLGLPPGTAVGAFDALAAFNSPNATTAAVGRAVYTIEASLTNIVTLGAWLLYGGGSDLSVLGVNMYAVSHQERQGLENILTQATARQKARTNYGRLCWEWHRVHGAWSSALGQLRRLRHAYWLLSRCICHAGSAASQLARLTARAGHRPPSTGGSVSVRQATAHGTAAGPDCPLHWGCSPEPGDQQPRGVTDHQSADAGAGTVCNTWSLGLRSTNMSCPCCLEAWCISRLPAQVPSCRRDITP